MRKKLATKLVLLVGAVALTVGLTSVSAHALAIVTPLNYDWTSNLTTACDATCVSGITGISGLTLAYSVTSSGVEAGSFASSYSTTFVPLPFTGNQGFFINYGGGSSIPCPLCVLAVNDTTNTDPNKYFYNLSASGILGPWNGTDLVAGQGFWLGTGTISSVAIYNTADNQGSSVPEPASLLMLGAGLAAIGIWRRKVSKG